MSRNLNGPGQGFFTKTPWPGVVFKNCITFRSFLVFAFGPAHIEGHYNYRSAVKTSAICQDSLLHNQKSHL